MTPGKLAAQSVHAALGLARHAQVNPAIAVVVLEVSDKKFREAVNAHEDNYVVFDAGRTEVPHGAQTCVAFLEEEPHENTEEAEF